MNVFVDNDVILDILLDRHDFSSSSRIMEYVENGKIKGFTSPVVFTNTYYLISKARTNKDAWKALRKLRLIFKVCNVKTSTVDKALASDFRDFEDAIQYYSAVENKMKYLVTRNKVDYIGEEVIVLSPQEMITVIEGN